MAVNTTPIFGKATALAYVQVSTANTGRDGTGTAPQLIAGVADGTLVTKFRFKATVTTTAGMIRLFLSLDGGTTKRLWAELDVAAITVGANTKSDEEDYVPAEPLYLANTSAIVYASTHNAEAINVFADGFTYAA